jgi:hypothetical protein
MIIKPGVSTLDLRLREIREVESGRRQAQMATMKGNIRVCVIGEVMG